MKRFITFGTLLLLTLTTNVSMGQAEQVRMESETHIFWQPGRIITEKDFQGAGPADDKYIEYCNKYSLCVSASTGLFAVMDIPEKKRMRGQLLEKVYIVPAFEKATSFIIRLDSTGISKEMVTFDIFELSARFARQQLQKLQDSVPGYGIVSIMFKSVEARAADVRDGLIHAYVKDVYIDNKPGAFKMWRERIDRFLAESEKYATKPEDCFRFIKNAPIDENYKMAKKVIGNLY